ncbi:MAG: UDP-2,3-diacylglucosamine diphosphatase LpxI [Variibacter sp.]|nr:UDP-2,3-diacylglucosamine diphosphatase LpxI [Variibacter sp.]
MRNDQAPPGPEAPPPHAAGDAGPVAIICGGGPLPAAVAEAAVRAGRDVYLLAIEGWADAAAVGRFRHDWIKLGQFGRIRRLMRAQGCRDVVFIGNVLRPSVRMLSLDWLTLRLLPRALDLARGGDDRLLSGLGRIFEEHGFRVVGAHELAPEILVPEGPLGRVAPSARDAADAVRGFAVIEAIGAFDIGQAAVVADGHVLAVEAVEGTDNMLARIADLREEGRVRTPPGVGVLVKAPKPQQDRRLDLPAIGPRTVENVRRAGLAGVAVRAGEVIVAEPAAVVSAADAAGLFVAGFVHGSTALP